MFVGVVNFGQIQKIRFVSVINFWSSSSVILTSLKYSHTMSIYTFIILPFPAIISLLVLDYSECFVTKKSLENLRGLTLKYIYIHI